jgi:hypothetical protein
VVGGADVTFVASPRTPAWSRHGQRRPPLDGSLSLAMRLDTPVTAPHPAAGR